MIRKGYLRRTIATCVVWIAVMGCTAWILKDVNDFYSIFYWKILPIQVFGAIFSLFILNKPKKDLSEEEKQKK